MSALRRKIESVASDPVLLKYGIALCLAHLATAYYWITEFGARRISSEAPFPICWPFLSSCDSLRIVGEQGTQAALFAYGALAAAAAWTFFAKRAGTALALLACLDLAKLYFYLLDISLMGNYHYMHFAAEWAFFFLPGARVGLQFLLVAMYVSAGLLKLNYEWLSGAAIPLEWLAGSRLHLEYALKAPVVRLLAGYVLFLELVIVFGLLARDSRVRWFALANLVAFHIVSWGIVGFLYPVIMFCLISIFLFEFLSGRSPTPLEAAKADPHAHAGAIALVACFLALQLAPKLAPGDTVLTGENRMFSLNMLDAKSDCVSYSFAKLDGRTIELAYSREQSNFNVRLWCDPYVHYYRARALCRELRDEPGFSGISLRLFAKRTSAREFQRIVDTENICAVKPYRAIGSNDWILKE